MYEFPFTVYQTNQQPTTDGDIRDERVRFGNAANDSAWGHSEVNGTAMIEMRNVPVELAVQIGRLLMGAPNLCVGKR